MDNYESLSHTKLECKYHVVFIPKCCRKTLYAELRRHLGDVFRKLAEQKESRIEEGHLLPDHAHMLISIPPKYAVSQGDRISRGGGQAPEANEFVAWPPLGGQHRPGPRQRPHDRFERLAP
jgi:hypothetical protein